MTVTEPSDNEYLSRPLIPDLKFLIEENRVRIQSSTTIHAAATMPSHIDIKGILALYKLVLQEAKAQKVPISYSRHIRRRVNERRNEYEADYAAMKKLFSQITDQFRVVKMRGLHMGVVNDHALQKMQSLCDELEQYRYGDRATSMFSGIQTHLADTHEYLTRNNHRETAIHL